MAFIQDYDTGMFVHAGDTLTTADNPKGLHTWKNSTALLLTYIATTSFEDYSIILAEMEIPVPCKLKEAMSLECC